MIAKWPNTVRGLVVGVVVGAAAVLAGRSEPVQRLELMTADARMSLASPADAPPIAIIGITQEDVHPDKLGALPWPRQRYAQAVTRLRRMGARVIVFDLYFSRPADDPVEDQVLGRAIADAGNVILPVYVKVDPREDYGRLEGGVRWMALPSDQYLERNVPEIARSAARQGHINLSAMDPDHIFRRVPAAVGFRDTGESFNALCVETAAVAVGGSSARVELDGRFLRTAGRQWPLDTAFPGCLPIDYSGAASKVDVHAWRWRAPFGAQRSIFLYSMSEFLRDDFPAEAVAGRIVFVGGLLYERHPDVHPTPAGQQPGVILHALAVQTLLGGRYPHGLPPVAQAAGTVFLALAVAVVCFAFRSRFSGLVVLAALIAVLGVSMALFETSGLLVDTVAPSLQLVAIGAVSVARRLSHASGALQKRERELDTLVEMTRISSSLVGAAVHKESRLFDVSEADVLVPPVGAGVGGAAEVVATTISHVIGAQSAACYLTDPETNELAVVAACGNAAEDETSDLVQAGTAAARQAMRDRRPVLWEARCHRGSADDDDGAADLLCVPITIAGRVAGAMAFFNKEPSAVSPQAHFTSDDLRLVTTFTHQAAVTLENARLYQSMHALFIEAIKSLAAAIDAKDPYTRGHTARVAQLCSLLGRQMALSEAELQVLHLAATLHDIGKIAIPEAVLNKPTALTDDERRIIEKHPVRGAIILEPVHQLRPIIPGIRHHHERWDGRGYPDGLEGDKIPLLGRVIAVADSYDAMTSDRPYRRARTDAEALEEVGRCAGSQFDPELAELFLARFPGVRSLFTAGAPAATT